jgi:hypothetical protein
MTRIPRPTVGLKPYLSAAVRDLERHGFCFIDAEHLAENSNPDDTVGEQLERFTQACRAVSNEKDQELLISDDANPPHLTVALAPKGCEGTMPGTWAEDADGKGLVEKLGPRERYDDVLEIGSGYR